MPHLLSIISDQAVPNLLFIRQFATEDAEYFFVTTMEMEDKDATDHLIAALHLPAHKCHRIPIDANDAMAIFRQLGDFNFPKEKEYIINITGGNKLMSQMVFQHFLDFDARMVYAPIQSEEYQQLYPEIRTIPKDTDINTSLDDYLRAYGFLAKSSLDYYEGSPPPHKLMKEVIHHGHPGKLEKISRASEKGYSKPDRGYLTGQWFELYCYRLFKESLQLDESQIACSVGVKRADSETPFEKDNEFDLMFVHKNDLYVIECKVYTQGNTNMRKISQPMYKLASLTQNFGLKCRKYLAVLGSFPADPKSRLQLENLQKNLGITKILDMDSFRASNGADILRVDHQHKINQLM